MTNTESNSTHDPVGGASLADRLARLEDREAIRSLCLTFGNLLDRREWGPYAELFAETGGIAGPIGTVVGHDAIRNLFKTTLKDVPQNAFHVYTEPMIDVDGDRATTRFTWLYIRPDANGLPQLLQFGDYQDKLVKESGTWRFELRSLTRHGGFPPYTR